MKRVLLVLHRYAGLVAGALVAAVALSGALMILEGHLLPSSFVAERYRIEPQAQRAAVDDIGSRIEGRFGKAPTQLTIRSDPSRPDEYRLGRRETVLVDPYTGEIIGFEDDFRTPFSRALWTFHATFLLGAPGRWIVGLSTAVLLVMLVAGVVLGYDTVKRGGRRTLSLRWPGNGRIWNRRFHTALGLAASAVLIIIAFTGCFIAFKPVENATMALLGAAAPISGGSVQSSPTPVSTRLSADAVLVNAGVFDGELPFSRVRVHFPAHVFDTYRIDVTVPGASTAQRIHIDQYSGERLFDPAEEARLREERLRWSVRTFHYGSFYGPVMEGVWLLACLTLPVFFVSGVLLWAGKRRRSTPNSCSALPNCAHGGAVTSSRRPSCG